MADQLEVAVIGAGYFSQFHYEAWSRLPQARITALTALDGNSARETAARFGVPAVYESAERLLKATRPDVVDIVTPPQTHKDLVELVARHGIQMVCQKPLADTLEDAREVVEIAERANVPLIVHERLKHFGLKSYCCGQLIRRADTQFQRKTPTKTGGNQPTVPPTVRSLFSL